MKSESLRILAAPLSEHIIHDDDDDDLHDFGYGYDDYDDGGSIATTLELYFFYRKRKSSRYWAVWQLLPAFQNNAFVWVCVRIVIIKWLLRVKMNER